QTSCGRTSRQFPKCFAQAGFGGPLEINSTIATSELNCFVISKARGGKISFAEQYVTEVGGCCDTQARGFLSSRSWRRCSSQQIFEVCFSSLVLAQQIISSTFSEFVS